MVRSYNLLQWMVGALCVVFVGCSALESVREPAMKFLRRGSCISVDLPPITLTPARTAAERQLIGEEGEIEEDGWLIASSQSAPYYLPQGGQTTAVATAERRYQIEQGVLGFYREPMLRYRSEGILGESYDGRLLLVPDSVGSRRDGVRWQEEIETARAIAEEVNRARDWIIGYDRAQADARGDRDAAEREATARRRYYEEAQARSGEWIYTRDRRWQRIR
ncbi:MAG: hypothetical protein K1X75_13050 [Leptospirales bacterium]|nr:hypothetical protein [Leptospirales bacterium]